MWLADDQERAEKASYMLLIDETGEAVKRYWTVLQYQSLSFYASPTEKYFPEWSVTLRQIRSILPFKAGHAEDAFDSIILNTNARQYRVRADSVQSTRSWYITLRNAIFQLEHGHELQIAIPLCQIIDVEQFSMIHHTKNLALRMLPDDDSFTIDEVWTFCRHMSC